MDNDREEPIKVCIQGNWLTDSKFKLSFLLKNLHEAFATISLPKIQYMADSIGKFNVEYLDEDKWVCVAMPSFNHVRISRGVVELVWVISYSHILLYTEIVEGKRFFGGKNNFKFSDNPLTKTAVDLLKMSLENWFNPTHPYSDIWKEKSINVTEESDDDYIKPANEMTRLVLSFYLYHEFGHLMMHRNEKDSIKAEKEADDFATAWFLDQSFDEDKEKRNKFALAVSLAFEILMIRCIHTGKCEDDEHPHSIDRMIDNIEKYIEDDDLYVWAFLCFTFKLHLDAAKITTPEKVYEDHRDCFYEYIRILRERK